MNLFTVSKKLIWKFGLEKELNAKVQEIRNEAGVKPINWDEYNKMLVLPPQEELEVPNEQHIPLYKKDLDTLVQSREEIMNLYKDNVPEYIWMTYLDGGGFEFYNSELQTLYSSGTKKAELSDKLRKSYYYLCESSGGLDFGQESTLVFEAINEMIEEDNTKIAIMQKGITGERIVSQELSKYIGEYHIMENVVIPNINGKTKTSETDVYIISSKGIVVCEVKNYGKDNQFIDISKDDKWTIRNADGSFHSRKLSPVIQNEEHCLATKKLIASKLGREDIPIISLVVIANDNIGIRNQNGCAVVTTSEIHNFIEQLPNKISLEDQKDIVDVIDANKLEAREFLVKTNEAKTNHLKEFAHTLIPYMKANVKIADYIYGLSSKFNMMGTIGVVVAIILAMLLGGLARGIEGVVILGIGMLGPSFTKSTFTFLLALVGVVLVFIWLVTLNHPLALIGLVCWGIGVKKGIFDSPRNN